MKKLLLLVHLFLFASIPHSMAGLSWPELSLEDSEKLSTNQPIVKGQEINLKEIYPFKTKNVFVYHWYDQHNKKVPGFENHSHEWSPDGKTFTIHHSYNGEWCPRVDDVFRWDNNQLFYTDTYDFYKGIRTTYTPGHLWGKEKVNAGDKKSTPTHGHIRNFTHENCYIQSETEPTDESEHVMAYKVVPNETAWSPLTGGKNKPVNVFRLEQHTYIHGNKDDWWKEEWYFYEHPQYGYIAIQTRGFRKELKAIEPELKWNMRLADIFEK